MISIAIPGLPPKECSPNSRVHYMAKARAARIYRNCVRMWAFSAGVSQLTGHWGPLLKARIDVTFIVPDRRRRDKTNFASAFKAGLDGLVDAGVIVDDSHEHIDDQYHIVYEKGKSMTIVEIERGAEAQ